MTTLPLTYRPDNSFTSALDLSLTILRHRYGRMLAPFILVGLSVGAILLLGGLMAPDVTGLVLVAVLVALVGIAVSFTAASVAAYRIAGALLFGDPETHINGEAVGSTSDEVQAAHGRVLPLFGLFLVQGVMVAFAAMAFMISLVFPPLLLVVLPGIWYVGIRFSLAAPEVVMGEDNAFRALSLSWALTDGHALKMAGLSILVAVLGVIVSVFGAMLGALLGESVQAMVDLLINVMWLPVGPATTMAFWGLLRA